MHHQADGHVIRRAVESDRDEIVRLVSKMAEGDGEARYEWIYRSNPHGPALTWLAIDQKTGRAVAATSFFPRKVLVGGKVRVGAVGGDCYVEPQWRGRGIATALHRASLASLGKGGVDFMYGPPTPRNLAALVKAGAHPVAEFETWFLPLSLRALYRLPALYRAPLHALRTRFRPLLRDLPTIVLRRPAIRENVCVTLERLQGFGPEMDGLAQRVASRQGPDEIVGVRDREYLAWRYAASPRRCQLPFAVRRDGELVGFVAVEFAGERASIIDLFATFEPKLLDAILHAVLGEVSARGCCIVDIGCIAGGHLALRLRGAGFLKASSRTFQVALSDADPQAETLLCPAAWHFMVADSDLDATLPRS